MVRSLDASKAGLQNAAGATVAEDIRRSCLTEAFGTGAFCGAPGARCALSPLRAKRFSDLRISKLECFSLRTYAEKIGTRNEPRPRAGKGKVGGAIHGRTIGASATIGLRGRFRQNIFNQLSVDVGQCPNVRGCRKRQ